MAVDPRTDCEAPMFWRGGVVSCGRCAPCVERKAAFDARAYRRAMGISHADDDAEATPTHLVGEPRKDTNG